MSLQELETYWSAEDVYRRLEWLEAREEARYLAEKKATADMPPVPGGRSRR